MAIRCMVCRRPLKDPKAAAAGIGNVCKKKINLSEEALQLMKEIRAAGWDPQITSQGVIQAAIPEEENESGGD